MAVRVVLVAVTLSAAGVAAHESGRGDRPAPPPVTVTRGVTVVADAAPADAAQDAKNGVGTELSAVLSVDDTRPGTAQAAARRYLTGSAAAARPALVRSLQTGVTPGHRVLTFSVTVSAVMNLAGGNARLLVFGQRNLVDAITGASATGDADYVVDARRSGGTWLISSIRAI